MGPNRLRSVYSGNCAILRGVPIYISKVVRKFQGISEILVRGVHIFGNIMWTGGGGETILGGPNMS